MADFRGELDSYQKTMGKRVEKRFTHQLPLDQLHERIVALAEEENSGNNGGDEVHFERNGSGYRLRGSYSGFSVNGAVTLTEEQLTIAIDLPMLARMFQGKVERYIEEQAARLLG